MKYIFIEKEYGDVVTNETHLKELIQANLIGNYRKILKPEPGMKVKLIGKRGNYWSKLGRMDKYIGAILTVKKLQGNHITFEEEGTNQWIFTLCDIEKTLE